MIVLMPLFRASLKCVACVCDYACFLQSLCQSLWFATINEDRFGSRPENIQFGESADVSSPNFVKSMHCHRWIMNPYIPKYIKSSTFSICHPSNAWRLWLSEWLLCIYFVLLEVRHSPVNLERHSDLYRSSASCIVSALHTNTAYISVEVIQTQAVFATSVFAFASRCRLEPIVTQITPRYVMTYLRERSLTHAPPSSGSC